MQKHLYSSNLLLKNRCVQSMLIAKSCLTLCDPLDYSPPGSSVHGIHQARIQEWVAIPFSRTSSWSRDQTLVSCIAGRCFTIWDTREAPDMSNYTSVITFFKSRCVKELEIKLNCNAKSFFSVKKTNKNKWKHQYLLKYYRPRDTSFSLNNFQMC